VSDAVALSVTVAPIVLPLAGDAPRETAGDVESGGAVTVKLNVAERTRLPAVPVTVIVDVANGVAAVVPIVIVVAQPGEHDAGVYVAVAPEGNPDVENVTGCVAPEMSAAVIELSTDDPPTTDVFPPLDRAKSNVGDVVAFTEDDGGELLFAASYADTA
jgi:hypothetical protein